MLTFLKFLMLLTTLLLAIGCQKSYRVLNHNEIKYAYNKKDLRYIPGLKEVVEKQNRDLGANAMLQLGNFYRDFSYKGFDRLTEKQRKIFMDLEIFFVSNVANDIDFNLKNIIYRNLMFSPNSIGLEIYQEVLNKNSNPTNLEYKENAIAVLGFVGQREIRGIGRDFDKSLSICVKGLDKIDSQIFMAGLECLYYLEKSYFNEKSKQAKILKILSEYKSKFQNDLYRYYAISSHHLLYNNYLLTNDFSGEGTFLR